MSRYKEENLTNRDLGLGEISTEQCFTCQFVGYWLDNTCPVACDSKASDDVTEIIERLIAEEEETVGPGR